MRISIRWLLAAICVVLLNGPAMAKSAVKVHIGIEIDDVYGINFPENKVSVSYLLWFNYDTPANTPLNLAEKFYIPNAIEEKRAVLIYQTTGHHVYQLVRGRVELRKPWTVIDYPFDDHTIRLFVAVSGAGLPDLELTPDTANSILDPNIRLNGWDIHPLSIAGVQKKSPSNLGASEHSRSDTKPMQRILAEFNIERTQHGIILFLKTFLPLFAAVALAILALGIRPDKLEARTNLAVVALLAAVSSQLVVNSTLPASSEPVFADFIHLISFLTIVASVFFMLHREKRQDTVKEAHVYQADRRVAGILALIYILLVGTLCCYYWNIPSAGTYWW